MENGCILYLILISYTWLNLLLLNSLQEETISFIIQNQTTVYHQLYLKQKDAPSISFWWIWYNFLQIHVCFIHSYFQTNETNLQCRSTKYNMSSVCVTDLKSWQARRNGWTLFLTGLPISLLLLTSLPSSHSSPDDTLWSQMNPDERRGNSWEEATV